MQDNPNPAQSASDVNQTQAGSQTGGAQAGAGSAAQQAGAQTGQAQSGAGAAYQSAGAETISDVGQAEAYIVNMKRQVARELDTDAHLQQILAAKAQREATANTDFDGQLRNIALQTLQNAVVLANRVNNAAIDLDTRIKQNAVDSDGRKTGNDEQYDKVVDSLSQSERERTVRSGDVLDVIREAGVSADTVVYQDVIEAIATRVHAKMKADAKA